MTLRPLNEESVETDGAGYDMSGSVATSVKDGFTMMAVGDLIVSRPLTKGSHEGFDRIVEMLRGGDVTLGNMETSIFDSRSFKGSPQAEFGGAYHASLPSLAADLKAMGFNIVSFANNHTFDWGVEGMRATCDALDENDIVHAGAGENLSQASAARFLETSRGRVALVSCATTFTPQSRAADAAADAPGRPGVNALRLTRNVIVTPEMLEDLKCIRDALPDYKLPQKDPTKAIIAEITFRAGSKPGFGYEPNPKDLANIFRSVRRGKQYSDFCVLANHGHEPGNWSQEPADYEQAFARAAIDIGADAYVAHGPHQLRGIEIYRGRPIFYSLANFIIDDLRTPMGIDMFETYGKDPRVDTDAEVTVSEMAHGYDTAPGFSDPIFYESVITASRFEGNRLTELRLFPVELRHSSRLARRGVPMLASSAQAKAILQRLQRLSEPFGTDMVIQGDVGLVEVKGS